MDLAGTLWPTHGAGSFCSAPHVRTNIDHGHRALPALAAAELFRLGETCVVMVDVRPVDDYAGAHVWDSVSTPLRPVFAIWLGCLLTAAGPLVAVHQADQNPTGSIRLATAEHPGDVSVLDIRQADEFTAGHVPGAAHVEPGHLADDSVAVDQHRPTVVTCGTGRRLEVGS